MEEKKLEFANSFALELFSSRCSPQRNGFEKSKLSRSIDEEGKFEGRKTDQKE